MIERKKGRLAVISTAALILAALAPVGASADGDRGGNPLEPATNEPFDWIGIVEGYNTIKDTVTISGRTYDMSGAALFPGRVVDGETGDERERRIEVGGRVGIVVPTGKPLRVRKIWLLPHE